MVTEKDYLEALDRAIKTKKQYLAAELENEGRSLLASLEDDSWSEKERIQQHPLLERLNPLAVCTIRVISLLMDHEVSLEQAVIRTLS